MSAHRRAESVKRVSRLHAVGRTVTQPSPSEVSVDLVAFEQQQRQKRKLPLLPKDRDQKKKVEDQQHYLNLQLAAMVSRASTSDAIDAAARANLGPELQQRLILDQEELQRVRLANNAHAQLMQARFPKRAADKQIKEDKVSNVFRRHGGGTETLTR